MFDSQELEPTIWKLRSGQATEPSAHSFQCPLCGTCSSNSQVFPRWKFWLNREEGLCEDSTELQIAKRSVCVSNDSRPVGEKEVLRVTLTCDR